MPSDNYIRVHAGSLGHISQKHSPGSTSPPAVHPSQHALQLHNHLEAVRTNKQYLSIKEHADYALEFMQNPGHALREAPMLFSELVRRLYPELNYLAVVRPRKAELL